MTRVLIIAVVQWFWCTNMLYAQNVELIGKVTDEHSHRPVELANVYLAKTTCLAYSKQDGMYRLSGVKPGNYELCVSCIGYITFKQQIELTDHSKQINIQLRASIEELSPIVITGTGTNHTVDNAPVQTDIISGEAIRNASGRSIEEIITGISASLDSQSSSMGSTIKINGLGEDYVMILVNGKRLTGSIGGRFDLTRISPEDIKQIEVVKGASSTLYGSDAIAGVINIITNKSKHKLSLTNSTRVGAYSEWRQLNALLFSRDKLSGKTSFSRSQTDGWQLSNMEFNSSWDSNHDLDYLELTYDKPVNKKHSYTIKQLLTYDFNTKLSVDAELSWYEKTLYFPFKGNMYNYYYNNTSVSVSGKYKLHKDDYIDFSAEYGNYLYYTEYPYKYNEQYYTADGVLSVTYYPGDRFKNSEQANINFSAKGVFHLNDNNTLSLGSEVVGDQLESKYRLLQDEVEAYTYAVFGQDEFKLHNNISIVGGVRFIYHRMFGFMATPKVSGMLKSGKFTNRINYAYGFKSPTLKELYYYYESNRMGTYTLYLGNEDLKPQKSRYYSASTQYKNKKFNSELALYINQINDMIDYEVIDTEYEYAIKGIEETKKRYNINEAQLLGFDWSFNYKPFTSLNVGGGYSYVDAENKTANIRLDGTSEHSATFKAAWNRNWNNYALNINVSGVYKSDKYYYEEDEDNEDKIYADPYQLWKLTTRHTLNKFQKIAIDLLAGMDNIFDYVDDRPYGSHYGTLNPGRTYFVGLNIKFTAVEKN